MRREICDSAEFTEPEVALRERSSEIEERRFIYTNYEARNRYETDMIGRREDIIR